VFAGLAMLAALTADKEEEFRTMDTSRLFDVGGVLLARPFRVRRLGHFGLNMTDTASAIAFYCDLLGFRISDPMDIAEQHPRREELLRIGDTNLYFTRHGTDHHSLVFCDRQVFQAMGRGDRSPKDVTVNQLTWQVGSLQEISGAIDYFEDNKVPINRAGRDMPGSNWHVYPYDPEGHRNELYYGIEQIGWMGTAKPKLAYERRFLQRPELPQPPEYEEVDHMRAQQTDLASGFRHPEKEPARYDVEGIMLARPFKVVRVGPVGLFCHDLEAMERFYLDIMGFEWTEDVVWQGHRCVFLRTGTEHHSLALYPMALRSQLGLDASTTLMRFGIQVATYRQLKHALDYLQERGCQFVDIPAELTPGIEYSAFLKDPSGHLIQLYYAMNQIASAGHSPNLAQRPGVVGHWQAWPEAILPGSGSFMGEPYLGPWG